MSKSASVRALLERAQEECDLVRVSRSIEGSDPIEGYVLEVGKELVALRVLNEAVFLDATAVVRVKHVTAVERAEDSDRFVRRFLEESGEWPPTGPALGLESMRRTVEDASVSGPMVTLYLEEEDPDVCFVGTVAGWGRRSVRLLEVNPQAEWATSVEKWPLKEITRVDVGGRYEGALALVAGSPPLELVGGDRSAPFLEVMRVLGEIDPEGLVAAGCPRSEYEPEAFDLSDLVRRGEVSEQRVREIWVRWFDEVPTSLPRLTEELEKLGNR